MRKLGTYELLVKSCIKIQIWERGEKDERRLNKSIPSPVHDFFVLAVLSF